MESKPEQTFRLTAKPMESSQDLLRPICLKCGWDVEPIKRRQLDTVDLRCPRCWSLSPAHLKGRKRLMDLNWAAAIQAMAKTNAALEAEGIREAEAEKADAEKKDRRLAPALIPA